MIFYTKKEQLVIKVTAQLKTRIKKFFAQYYGLDKEVATLADIKRRYPGSNFRSSVAWLEVLADMFDDIKKDLPAPKTDMRKTVKKPVKLPLHVQIQNLIKATPNLEIESFDFLLGTVASIRYVDANKRHSLSVGRFGWSEVRQRYIFSTRQCCLTFMSLTDAFNALCKYANVVAPQLAA